MKVTAACTDLAVALQPLGGIVVRSSTSPLLSHCLLTVDGDTLTVAATDTEIALSVTLAVAGQSDGAALVDAGRLLAIVRSLPGPAVSLSLTDHRTSLLITSGRTRMKVPALDANDVTMPAPIMAAESVTIAGADLSAMLGRVLPTMARDEARYGLNGVHLEPATEDGRGLRMVTTDGHRLTITEGGTSRPAALPSRQLIPHKAAVALSKLTGDVALTFGESAMEARTDGSLLWCRLVDGEFPDYAAVLPTGAAPTTARVDRATLLATVKRAEIIAPKGEAARFDFGDADLTVTARSGGSGLDEPVVAEVEGGPFAVGLRPAYLHQGLAAFEGHTVCMALYGELLPVILTATDEPTTVVLMPMRLD